MEFVTKKTLNYFSNLNFRFKVGPTLVNHETFYEKMINFFDKFFIKKEEFIFINGNYCFELFYNVNIISRDGPR